MNNIEFDWCGYKWISQERWGDAHPDKPNAIYDGKMIQFNKDGSIALHVSKNDKKIYSVGLISCKEHFGYGTFELDVKFPKGNNLWPSFWMWSYNSWPPEIDIFEGYSECYEYNKGGLKHDIRPNVHYGESSKTHQQVGARKPLALWTLNPTEKWNHFSCKYTPNSITIFYNHIPVFFECRKKVMKWFNEHIEQNVIINNTVSEKFCDADLKDMSPMVVKNFKFTPYKEL